MSFMSPFTTNFIRDAGVVEELRQALETVPGVSVEKRGDHILVGSLRSTYHKFTSSEFRAALSAALNERKLFIATDVRIVVADDSYDVIVLDLQAQNITVVERHDF